MDTRDGKRMDKETMSRSIAAWGFYIVALIILGRAVGMLVQVEHDSAYDEGYQVGKAVGYAKGVMETEGNVRRDS